MLENNNQKALRKWICAGLKIHEVLNLHGDSKYLFNNMIAKYTLFSDEYKISTKALNKLRNEGIDLEKVYYRRRFYGRGKPYIYEHLIPVTLIREILLKSDHSQETVKDILRMSGNVVVLLRSEDELLKTVGLNSRMPDEWSFGDDPLYHY